MNAIVNAIKLGGIMQVLEIIKRLSFIVTMYVCVYGIRPK